MMQVCRQLDMTYQTLKYYCNEGLIPNVKRDSNNRRIFDEKDVKWIKDLTCLKKCGMSIQEMKEYLQLCLQGTSTIMPRKEMLRKKQEALRASIKELEDSVAYIDWKQNFYDEVLSGKRPYISNLIQVLSARVSTAELSTSEMTVTRGLRIYLYRPPEPASERLQSPVGNWKIPFPQIFSTGTFTSCVCLHLLYP